MQTENKVTPDDDMTPYNKINQRYIDLLQLVIEEGDRLETRNHAVYSHIGGLQVQLDSFPLVTCRRTAWKKALREMEWFMSGDPVCPSELLDWWKGQLNRSREYQNGYPAQLRYYTSEDEVFDSEVAHFDQTAFVFDAIQNHPNSRRIVTTTWHPEEMSQITKLNGNPNTPTTCHGTITQYFVRNNALFLHTYQRSADLLLGVPHNWVQYWALLIFFAYHCRLSVGGMTWTFGDAHIYDDPSHLDCVNEILESTPKEHCLFLEYNYSGGLDHVGLPQFKATDFNLAGGDITAPITTIKPRLF